MQTAFLHVVAGKAEESPVFLTAVGILGPAPFTPKPSVGNHAVGNGVLVFHIRRKKLLIKNAG